MNATRPKVSKPAKLLATIAIAWFLPACQSDNRLEARRMLNDELAARQAHEAESLSSYRQAVNAYEKGDLKEAKTLLRKALAAHDRNAYAWMLLGMIEHQEDNVFEAADCFHRASLLAPDRYEPLYNIAMLLESFGKYKPAIENYRAALKLCPDQLEVMECLARCYIREGSDLDQAQELIDQSLRIEQRPEWRQWLTDQSRKLAARKGGNP